MRRRATLGERLGGFLRSAKSYYAVVPLAVPVLISTMAETPSMRDEQIDLGPRIEYMTPSTPEAPVSLPPHSAVLPIEPGDTLDKIFTAGGLTPSESAVVVRSFAESIDLRKLKPGNVVRFEYDNEGAVRSLALNLAGWGDIRAKRDAASFEVIAEKAPERLEEAVVSSSIQSSLYEAICGNGETPALVSLLVDVFQWDVDFFNLKQGDSFTLVVDKKFVGNALTGYGPIKAARFVHHGQSYEAFRFEHPDGSAGYYARSGTPLRKQFLKAPLRFSRITSGFTKRRFHPVLKRFRPHYGVDYGAPTGTPVMSTADGVVTFAGFDRGEGNYVTIRHNARMKTHYLHLSRFAKGLKKGTRVQQGDVIGYVGSTGMSTGPHLDYRVSDGSGFINPLKLKSITPDPLRGEQLRRFRTRTDAIVARFAASSDAIARGSGVRAPF
jgi:murein DD-endopeptidase MepM/ murein hydrolase activator NlpD